MGLAPLKISSAGWNRKTAVPGTSRRRAASISASVMPIAVCPSWPHACMTPGVADLNGRSSVSVRGKASMSARHAMVRPGRSPRSTATTPVRPTPVRTSSLAAVRRSATISAVRRSSNDSSGWRWKSRLSATMPSRRRPISSAHSGVVLPMARSLAARGLVTPYCPACRPVNIRSHLRSAAGRAAGGSQGSRRPRGTRALLRSGWAPSRRGSSAAAWRERVPSTPANPRPPAPSPSVAAPAASRLFRQRCCVHCHRIASATSASAAPGRRVGVRFSGRGRGGRRG